MVVAKDQPKRPGWGPETSAACDPSEFPENYTDKQPYDIWTDEDGNRVPTYKVSGSPGPAHCDWEKAYFLGVGRGEGADAQTYVRDPSGTLTSDKLLTSAYEKDAPLPDDARDTGYRLDDWELWLSPDASRAYVRTADGVEAWPTLKQGMGCA
ncbi:hypothetical protein U9R90_35405 [Streptomyces sp. E11-3]|uniref:hypothetical protein n=1 Tax=Streptomyces sp. E11-3 TaxID=3110112 RepID=UPI0039804EFA